MSKQVTITTPIPTVEETARIVGVSSDRVQELVELARSRALLLNPGEMRRAKVATARKRNSKKRGRAQ